MTKATCSTPECGKTIRARGLCSTHYNQQHQPTRHRPRTVACAVCGTETQRTGGGGKGRQPVCSEMCRVYRRIGRWPSCRLPVKVERIPKPKRVPVPRQRLWVQGPCTWCGTPFTAESLGDAPRYCSRRCSRKRARVQRRASEKDASGTYTWSEVMRIYMRIGGCAYCWQPSDDLEPDHVIPLSRGGSNSITNVVPACSPCNHDKRTLLLSEWAADRERRGLEPRPLHPKVNHLTHALLTAS